MGLYIYIYGLDIRWGKIGYIYIYIFIYYIYIYYKYTYIYIFIYYKYIDMFKIRYLTNYTPSSVPGISI